MEHGEVAQVRWRWRWLLIVLAVCVFGMVALGIYLTGSRSGVPAFYTTLIEGLDAPIGNLPGARLMGIYANPLSLATSTIDARGDGVFTGPLLCLVSDPQGRRARIKCGAVQIKGGKATLIDMKGTSASISRYSAAFPRVRPRLAFAT